MSSEDDQQRRGGPHDAALRAGTAQSGISRRAALGRISAGAAVGTTAWVIPQILTARPAAGATLSGSPATTGTLNFPVPKAAAPDGPSTLSNLATTGLDLQRDAEIGAAMIAVGWALHRWASRSPEVATRPAVVPGKAGSQGDSA